MRAERTICADSHDVDRREILVVRGTEKGMWETRAHLEVFCKTLIVFSKKLLMLPVLQERNAL
jgi:hypothetical protein